MTVAQLNLPGHQRGRLWVDEYPAMPNFRDGLRIDKWTSKGTIRCVWRKVAIEWLVPRGMGAMYGLLGAELTPSDADFEIEVLCVDGAIRMFSESIVSSPSEQVFCGLACEYAGSVMSGMREVALEQTDLPQATVACNIAANALVGSCNVIFHALARALLQTLLLPKKPTEADVQPLLMIDN